jgi:hypothetical protein
MTHFRDLTPYSYGAAKNCSELHARNIGWLAAGVEFPRAPPLDAQFVERLWRFCKVSIGQTRGLHECELCCSREANVAQRNGEDLLLGSAEIRVILDEGQLYAAPNLIFHYVASHNYSPPPEFVEAVLMAPCPPEESYYELLSKLELRWSDTLVPKQGGKSFKFAKTPEGVVRIEE